MLRHRNYRVQKEDKTKEAEYKTQKMDRVRQKKRYIWWMECEKEVGVFSAEEIYGRKPTDGKVGDIFQEKN